MQKLMMRSFNIQHLKFLLGPWMLIPQGVVVALFVGVYLYEIPIIHGDYEKHLFLQGNIDMGGSQLFAATIALYVIFGFTTSWYLILKLEERQLEQSYLMTFLHSLQLLKFHILAFIIGGSMHIGYDSSITPNDFRNMFLLAFFLYLSSILFICALYKFSINRKWKLLFAPVFIVFWLFIGSDGNTARAGQVVSWENDYQYIIRGKRHAVMLCWHRICDSIMSNVE